MDKQKVSVLDDIKTAKTYILGVLAFATAVSAFLVIGLGLNQAMTLLVVGGLAIMMLVIGWLIMRSENRQKELLSEHIAQASQLNAKIQKMLEESACSNLRTEMNWMMYLKPDNHDTILKMAHRYFVEMKGDWVETDEFGAWIDRENAAGRAVYLPPHLATVVANLRENEKA